MVKILLSDDNKEVLDSMLRLLEMFDTEVHGFQYNDQAMNDLATFTPDYILTDYDYGGGYRNGVDYIKALRASGVTTPIALVTGSSKRQLSKEIEGIENVIIIEKGMEVWQEILSFVGLKTP